MNVYIPKGSSLMLFTLIYLPLQHKNQNTMFAMGMSIALRHIQEEINCSQMWSRWARGHGYYGVWQAQVLFCLWVYGQIACVNSVLVLFECREAVLITNTFTVCPSGHLQCQGEVHGCVHWRLWSEPQHYHILTYFNFFNTGASSASISIGTA